MKKLPRRLKPRKGTKRSPFVFYEKVLIQSKDRRKASINGRLGAIMGMVQEDSGAWGYSVHIYGQDESWAVAEHELKATGEFDRHETFYSGASIQVRVDKQGRGHIAGYKPAPKGR